MYSQFTVNLINEVKKREVLYNNKYDKRPKADKEKSWTEIGIILNEDPEKCKKHWKNIRDRFVKIKHARDKHFMNNGSELTAPGYIYYDMLSFMTEFSIKKVITSRESQPVDIHEITPEPLIVTDEDKVIDMTKDFLREVKRHPALYDPSAQYRSFRGRNEWKEIADALYSQIPIKKLQTYWSTLLKQYKLFEDHRHQFTETINNEYIFDLMTFVGTNDDNADDKVDDPVEFITFENTCKMERDDHSNSVVNVIDEFNEDYEAGEIVHQNFEEDESEDEDMSKNNKFTLSHGIFGPEPKKPKYSTKPAPSREPKPKTAKCEEQNLDEFDYFGKKVAMQLRNLASLNQKLSRRAEIEVLQLLMKYEDTAESSNSV
ncbi:uncharacterized protein [Chironomus tepperi]|uniref:uncharacterized protein n=1 Tax=Chironomus tepperi TaxID=113505 RepID=UPI00391F2118